MKKYFWNEQLDVAVFSNTIEKNKILADSAGKYPGLQETLNSKQKQFAKPKIFVQENFIEHWPRNTFELFVQRRMNQKGIFAMSLT